MGIEWIEDFGYGGDEFVTVTYKATKQVYLSSKIVKKYLSEEIKYARIGVDIDDKILYIKPITHNDSRAVRLSSNGHGNVKSKTIGSNYLIDRVIDLANQPKNTTIRYEVKWNKTLQALEVYLNKPLGEIKKGDNLIWQ